MSSHARNNYSVQTTQQGFTLVELLVVLAIGLILFGLISLNLGHTQTSTSLASVTETLMADIKQQQLKAMSGDIGSTSSQQPQGIYIQSGTYTLFAGSSYSAGDSNNFDVSLPVTVTLSTNFASSRIVFAKGDGSVTGFVNGNNTITLTGTGSNKTITIGRFGALTVN